MCKAEKGALYQHCWCSCRFFGSRFDDANNFNRSMDEVVADLAAVATAVAKVSCP